MEAPSITGEIAYEIPGAEVFLGMDSQAENIYFLTNKAFSNP